MLPGKLPLSKNEERNKCWFIGDTSPNSPGNALCVPNNSPEISPEHHIPYKINGDLQNRRISSSPVSHSTFIQSDIQNECQGTFSSQEGNAVQWNKIPKCIPFITLSSDIQPSELNYANSQAELGKLGESPDQMESDQNNSFCDRLSSMATYATSQGSTDSMSDLEKSFSDEDFLRRTQSLSLNDVECHKSLRQFTSRVEIEDFKWRKRAFSLDDLDYIASKIIEFESPP